MAGTRTDNELVTFAGTTTHTGSPPISTPYIGPTGLTGATAASRYAGATTGGPPTSGTFAVGDFVKDQAGPIWACTVAGTPGTWVLISPNLELYAEPYIASSSTPPVAVTTPRGTGQIAVSLTTGIPVFRGVALAQGQVVSNITVLASAAQNGGSHAWTALADTTPTVRAVSADNTGTAFFSASSPKTITLTTPYTVPTTGLYFVVLGVTASTMPTFVGGPNLAVGQAGMGLGQPLCGTTGSIGAPPAVGTSLSFGALAAANLYAVLS